MNKEFINNKMEPKVSVIVPTKDRTLFLKKAIESLLEQTYENVEIIVVNDGGKTVLPVIDGYREEARIIYAEVVKTKGPAAARNCGLKKAGGKYIAYLDDDDVFYPDHIETLVAYLEKSECKAAYSDAYCIHQEYENGEYVTKKKDLPYSFDFDQDLILVKNLFPALCLIHEKSCLDEAGYFDETLETHEDWDLWIRLSRKYKFAHVRKVTCEYTRRRDSTSLTGERKGDFLRTLRIIHGRYGHFLKDRPLLLKSQQKIEGLMKAEIDYDYKVAPIQMSRKPSEIDAAVSVIIPLNCNNDNLKDISERIASQKKVRDIEILIGGVASKARGDYFVIISQDSMPCSDYWLYNMLCPFIEYSQLAALTCKKIVRPGNDLFDLWMSNNSESSFEFEKDYYVFPMHTKVEEGGQDYFEEITKKRLNFFNNTATCYRKINVEEISRKVSFGREDVAAGVELLKIGRAVGYLKSTGTYCSRKSGADLVLKRYYVRTKNCCVSQISYFLTNDINLYGLLASITGLHEIICATISDIKIQESNPAAFIKSFLSLLDNKVNNTQVNNEEGLKENISIEKDALGMLIKDISVDRVCPVKEKHDFKKNCILADFMRNFESFAAYVIGTQYDLIGTVNDFTGDIKKIFAMTAGEALGTFYLEMKDINQVSDELERLNCLLENDSCYK